MKNRLIAGLSAVVFAAAIFSGSAEAAPKSKVSLSTEHVKSKPRHKSRKAQVSAATTDRVVGLIKGLAPQYGVPTWFALRIAKVESGYNPNTRGAAGEYGVYQMKCATAKGKTLLHHFFCKVIILINHGKVALDGIIYGPYGFDQ